MTDELPLPEPVNFSDVQLPGNDEFNRKHAVYGYTADQMRDYGDARAVEALERIASFVEGPCSDMQLADRNELREVAAAIRALKEG